MKLLALYIKGILRGSIPSLALRLTNSFPMAPRNSLPPYVHGSVPCWWLAFTRAGLSSWFYVSLSWRTHIYSSLLTLFKSITLVSFDAFDSSEDFTEGTISGSGGMGCHLCCFFGGSISIDFSFVF